MFKKIPLLLLLFSAFLSAQDHSEFLEGPFETPLEVTEQCLMCHDLGEEVMSSHHWKWPADNNNRNFVNDFAMIGKNPELARFHISFGYKEGFDLNDPSNIDCLVCHEQTGTYEKGKDGMPVKGVDLEKVAYSVGQPEKSNCASCHFNDISQPGPHSAGLDNSMEDPSMELDVHMGGMGFGCADCHATDSHETESMSCEDCHGTEIHKLSIIDRHYESVECQSCHIPSLGREEAIVTSIDRSAGGDGKFSSESNVKPYYSWTTGKMDYVTKNEKVQAEETIELNKPTADISNADAKVAPFLSVNKKLPYNPENNTLTSVAVTQDGGFESADGEMVDAKMYLPINHQVAPADQALRCLSCHGEHADRIDWKKLGYQDDPLRKRGRKENNLLK